MDIKYIIVQAGGRGSRMERLTLNKPKALVPVNNLPMIFHLFRKYPKKKFIIIGDYQFDVLKRYLREFAEVSYELISAKGYNGTCAGLTTATAYVPDKTPFLLIWCDLILPEKYSFPQEEGNYIGISKDFLCRWLYHNGNFEEKQSSEHGVAGFFIFKDKEFLRGVPDEGELVRWLQKEKCTFREEPLYKTHEYGLLSEWEKLPVMRCRPFNKMKIEGDRLYKIPIDGQGKKLAVREIAWYQKLKEIGFYNIPMIYSYSPLCMEHIVGKNIYEYTDISLQDKRSILRQVIDCLRQIHGLESRDADVESYRSAYLDKTYDRLKKVRYLVPFANDRTLTINGKVCRNIFYHKNEVENLVMQYVPDKFRLIHGDCTFSNIMLKEDGIPILIDPRGYFGDTELYGDTAYDWVKLYYSLHSNYDQFNLKRFRLYINSSDEEKNYSDGHLGICVEPQGVRVVVESNHWEELEDYFFELLDGEIDKRQMKLFLAITWLSLTTYAWEDYDSICAAFYNGLYYLEEVL